MQLRFCVVLKSKIFTIWLFIEKLSSSAKRLEGIKKLPPSGTVIPSVYFTFSWAERGEVVPRPVFIFAEPSVIPWCKEVIVSGPVVTHPLLCWHEHGDTDILTQARCSWRPSVSPPKNILPAECCSSEQRHLLSRTQLSSGRALLFFCYLRAVRTYVSEERECEYHFCWVVLWILSRLLGGPCGMVACFMLGAGCEQCLFGSTIILYDF